VEYLNDSPDTQAELHEGKHNLKSDWLLLHDTLEELFSYI
jgi:hypothetical protein